MKKKVVRLSKLKRLHVHTKQQDQGVGPCAVELSSMLTCWSNAGDGMPDAAECRKMVTNLTNCMRSYVYSIKRFETDIVAQTSSSKIDCQFPFVRTFNALYSQTLGDGSALLGSHATRNTPLPRVEIDTGSSELCRHR